MKNKCELPFEKAVVHSLPYSIVKANLGDAFMQILSQKYTNCQFVPSAAGKFSVSIVAPWFSENGLMTAQTMSFFKETLTATDFDLIQLIKNFLSAGSYVSGSLPLCKIDAAVTDARLLYFLITGFDDAAGVLSVKGIDADKHFYEYTVSYPQFPDALLFGAGQEAVLSFWKCNPSAPGLYDPAVISMKLGDYLNSRYSNYTFSDDKIFGLAAMEALAKHFLSMGEKREPLEYSYLYAFMEHKYVMQERIRFFADKGIVPAEYVPVSQEMYWVSQEICHLGELYNKTEDTAYIEQIAALIRYTIQKERVYLAEVLVAFEEQM